MTATSNIKSKKFTLKQGKFEVDITNFGGKLMAIRTPNKNGEITDVILGYHNPEDYHNGNPYFGAIIGRVANRISKGSFILSGKKIQLPINAGEHHLHGGNKGLSMVTWKVLKHTNTSLELYYYSKAAEDNYPANVEFWLTYKLSDANTLQINVNAKADSKTIINITTHPFFNLNGVQPPISDISKHELQIKAKRYTPIAADGIPLGSIKTVKGTALDFTIKKPVQDALKSTEEQIKNANGIDHNYIIESSNKRLLKIAELSATTSGISLSVYSNQPCVQIYTGNFLDGSDIGKNNSIYPSRSAICIEPQGYPDAPNHPLFKPIVVQAEEEYQYQTHYKFSNH